jgi:hypothetical protein
MSPASALTTWCRWHAPPFDGHRAAIMTVVFAPGTPAEARGLIGIYLAVSDLPAELRVAIERLAGNESMEPFWRQLPTRLRDRSEDIIAWTISAYIEAISLQPPLKVLQKERDDFLEANSPITDPTVLAKYKTIVRKRIPLTYGMLTEQARMLSDSLNEISSVGRQHWAEAWPGNPELTFEKLRSIVDEIAACCDRLDTDARQFRATQRLPEPPRKRGGHTAQHVHFSRILKARFRAEFRQPYAAVVASLLQVAFDLPEAVDESTVLKR